MGESLSDRSGLLTFARDELRCAAERRYFRGTSDRVEAHRVLSRYFGSRRFSPRTVEELPWHLARTESWAELAQMLAQPAYLRIAWTRPFEVRSAWAEVEAHSPFRMVQAYRSLLDGTDASFEAAWPAVMLLNDAGYHVEALALGQRVALSAQATGDLDRLRGALNALVVIAKSLGRFEDAERLLDQHERMARQAGDRLALAANMIDRGAILLEQGAVERAWKLP